MTITQRLAVHSPSAHALLGKHSVRVSLCVLAFSISTTVGAESLLERGSYLVNALMACDNCHTPRGPSGLKMDQRFSGGSLVWDEPTYRVQGPNITQDYLTGIGTWSDAQIKSALTEGIRPDSSSIAPIMPFSFYRAFMPRDLDAVIAYLRTIPAISSKVPNPQYKARMVSTPVPSAEISYSESQMNDPVMRGQYLVTLAHCMECHARRPDGKHDYVNGLGKGGHEMRGPFGSVVVSNITSHPTKGIGLWSDAEIKGALTEGKSRDGRPFKLPMARQNYFSKMSQADIGAIVAYLRTLPALE